MTGLNLDEMLARVTTLNATNTTQARTYLTDALGSVMAQTQDNQSTLAGYSYSPYGQTQSTGNTEGDSVQYTGRENDHNGLYYYRARYYDPVLKRFLSEDPIGLAGGSLSFYAYVNGNPVSYVDPEGLQTRINLFGPNEPQRRYADATPQCMCNDVYGHGNVAGMWEGYPSRTGGRQLTTEELWRRISRDPSYDPNLPIRLGGCNVGQGNTCRDLARMSSSAVICPDNLTWYGPDGLIGTYPKLWPNGPSSDPVPDYRNPGSWPITRPPRAK
ncbi:MAG: RHS repeat-associated core domain-containing protein [Burkholderiales bacterium]|jgi:RHS repeat-associated protein